MNHDETPPDSIAIRWSTDDVAERCRELDIDLNPDGQRRVLQGMKKHHDANVGINWDVVDFWIGQVSEAACAAD